MLPTITAELTCARCGLVNSVAAQNLTLGDKLSCSHCHEVVGVWIGNAVGFVPDEQVASRLLGALRP
jgi:hypothetical protein